MTNEKISDTFTVHLGDNEKTVKMTYGLLQSICSRFSDFGQIQNLSLDVGMQNAILNEVIDDRNPDGARKNPNKDYSMDLSIEEGEKFSNWIVEHIVHFFILRLESQNKTVEGLKPVLEKIVQSVQEMEMKANESNPA